MLLENFENLLELSVNQLVHSRQKGPNPHIL